MTNDFRTALRGTRTDGNTVEFTSRAAISQTIVHLEAAGEGFRTPLFRAAADGSLNVATAAAGAPILARILKHPRPTAVVLMDDHPDATGPGGWPQARKLLRWADAAVFHGAGGEAGHYEAIAAATVLSGRVLVVEMEYRHMPAWMALAERHLPRLNVLRIVPREGRHPIGGAPAGAEVH